MALTSSKPYRSLSLTMCGMCADCLLDSDRMIGSPEAVEVFIRDIARQLMAKVCVLSLLSDLFSAAHLMLLF